MNELTLSTLPKTWIFDLDGTLVEHNGYKTGKDKLLPGVKEFLDQIPKEDFVLILTGRESAAEKQTKNFFEENELRCDKIIFEVPLGERILFNDKKPSGLELSFAVNLKRNEGLESLHIKLDQNL